MRISIVDVDSELINQKPFTPLAACSCNYLKCRSSVAIATVCCKRTRARSSVAMALSSE